MSHILRCHPIHVDHRVAAEQVGDYVCLSRRISDLLVESSQFLFKSLHSFRQVGGIVKVTKVILIGMDSRLGSFLIISPQVKAIHNCEHFVSVCLVSLFDIARRPGRIHVGVSFCASTPPSPTPDASRVSVNSRSFRSGMAGTGELQMACLIFSSAASHFLLYPGSTIFFKSQLSGAMIFPWSRMRRRK